MSLAILFHFLCAQHVSDINISIIRSLRLFCWITTLVELSLVRCVLEFRCGWDGMVSVLQAEAQLQPAMSETFWAHKKWNKIATDIMLVSYSSTITMMHGPINIRLRYPLYSLRVSSSCLRLLPRSLVTFIVPPIFPSITCFRRPFVRKMWPIQLAFRLFYCLCQSNITPNSFEKQIEINWWPYRNVTELRHNPIHRYFIPLIF